MKSQHIKNRTKTPYSASKIAQRLSQRGLLYFSCGNNEPIADATNVMNKRQIANLTEENIVQTLSMKDFLCIIERLATPS